MIMIDPTLATLSTYNERIHSCINTDISMGEGSEYIYSFQNSPCKGININ